ncbi:MAG: hypothetical protein KAX68_09430 [Giesbergeria sp.]|jgi:hypothetical protein|nr:hypothetical protein [Giesbergeria sp.]
MSARTLEGRAMTEAEHAEYLRVISDTVLRDRAVGISDRFMKAAFTAVGGASTSVSSYPLVAAHMQASAIAYLAERLAVALAPRHAPEKTTDA